jgi:hypothetical protein
MGRFLDAAFVFARDHVRVPAIGVAVALVPAGLSVPGAQAGAAARAASGHPGRVAGRR